MELVSLSQRLALIILNLSFVVLAQYLPSNEIQLKLDEKNKKLKRFAIGGLWFSQSADILSGTIDALPFSQLIPLHPF